MTTLTKFGLVIICCVSVSFALTFQEVCVNSYENAFFKSHHCTAKEYEGGLDTALKGCKKLPNGRLFETIDYAVVTMMKEKFKEEVGNYTTPKLETHLEPEQVVVVNGIVKPMTAVMDMFMVQLFGTTTEGKVEYNNEILTMKFDLKLKNSIYWYRHPNPTATDLVSIQNLTNEITENANIQIEIMFTDNSLNLKAANSMYSTSFSTDTPAPHGQIFFIVVSGLFDTHSITTESTALGNRFYGPYINCPRVGLKVMNRGTGEGNDKGWKWINKNMDFYPWTYFAWDSDAKEPDNKGGKEMCACYNLHAGKIHDIDCDTPAPYVCEYPEIDKTKAYENCLAGVGFQEPLLLQNKERCLQVAGIEPNWTVAMEYCNMLGGHLFHIYNIEDFDSIIQWFKKLQANKVGLDNAGYMGFHKVGPHNGDFTGTNIQAMIEPTKPISDQMFMADQLDATKIVKWDADSKIDSHKIGVINTCAGTPTLCSYFPTFKKMAYFVDETIEETEYHAICEFGTYKSQKKFRGKKYNFNRADPYSVLSGMPNEMRCADHCALADHCLGFNYIKNQTSGSAACELMAREDEGFDLAPNGGLYYEKVSVKVSLV